jgi:LysM repeat protein
VQAGDNWFSIARRYGITQEALAAYNNSQPSDILQVGQVLRVPAAGAAIPLPPTPTPARPTAVPAVATPTLPAATPTPVIPTVAALAAPGLIAPMTGDGFTSGAQPVLSWRPVSGFGPQDYYYVLVRYVMRDGQRGYVDDRVTGTSYAVPIWVYDVAAPPDRLATWSVQVRRMGPGNQEIELSPPSESRTFYWR